MKKAEIGKIGEDLACEFLINRQYKILIRNYRKKFGEIDIICRSIDGILIFVEVKTLFSAKQQTFQNGWLFSPEDNFTTQKRNKVKRTSEFFVAKFPYLIDEQKGWRIDLIAVEIFEMQGTNFSIRHYDGV